MELSEIQVSVIEEFITETDFAVKYLAGAGEYFANLDKRLKEVPFTIIDLKKDISPLAPFLEILAKEKIDDDFLDEFCYFPQKKTFKSYFEKGFCDRRYDIFVEENLNFEKKTFRQTIVSLLEENSTGKFLILNAQELGDEALQIVRDLEKSNIQSNFIFCFDTMQSNNFSECLRDYLSEKSNSLDFLDISDESDFDNFSETKGNKFSELKNFDDVFNFFHNNRLFANISEIKRLAEWISRKLFVYSFEPEQLRAIYREIGLAFYYSQNYDQAILYLNNAIEDIRNDLLSISVYVYLAKIFLVKRNLSQAVKYALLAQEICNEVDDFTWFPLAKMMEYLTTSRYETETSIQNYQEALALLKKAGYTVNYINTANNVPWNLIVDPKWFDFIKQNLMDAGNIAVKISNIPEIASNNHWLAVMYSHNGKEKEASVHYNESNRLRTQLGELLPLVKIRNALSYEALIKTDYSEAYILLNSIMDRIYDLNHHTSLLNTLRNLGYSLFYSRQFAEAYKIFVKLITFLQDSNSDQINANAFLPSIADIMTYKAYIEFENGDYIHAKIACNQLLKHGKYLNPIEKPILILLRAIIILSEGNLEQACDLISEGIDSFKQIDGNQGHKICFIYCEFANALQKYGYKNEVQKYIDLAYEHGEQNNYIYYAKGKNSYTLDDYLENTGKFEPLNLNLEYLKEKYDKEVILNQLHNRIYEYQFLNKIMTLGADTSRIEVYLNHAVQTIMDYASVDAVFIAEKTEYGWKEIASISSMTKYNFDSIDWDIRFKDSVENHRYNLYFDEDKCEYYRNISKFDFVGCIFIVPRKEVQVSVNTLNILDIAITNIQSQIVMIKQEEHLLYVSSTDLLSMLNNRRALQNHLANESGKLQRYSDKRNYTITETIGFIDLDNFKYYNDNYGHEAGDIIISSFGKLLKNVFRNVDFLSRFGSDEFVVVMTDTNCQEGKIVVERLYEALAKADYFIPELEKITGEKLNIPENRRIGFSMGLCSNMDVETSSNFSTVLMNADQALHYAKENKKGSACLWSEIKDLIK